MPSASEHPCSKPGCGALTRERFCKNHKGSADNHRRSSSDRGYTGRWDRFSKSWRAANPLCVWCDDNGRTTAVDLVDHIVPVHVAPDRMFDPTNVQSLCRSCHKIKTDEDTKTYGAAR